MSEEILEQTAEELEEEQQAVAESSGEEILDEAKAKVEEDEDGEEEEEMEEAVSTPKTKAGMIKALYNQLNGMKKSDLSDSFSKIMGSTLPVLQPFVPKFLQTLKISCNVICVYVN